MGSQNSLELDVGGSLVLITSELGIHDAWVYHTYSHRFVRFFFTAQLGESRVLIPRDPE